MPEDTSLSPGRAPAPGGPQLLQLRSDRRLGHEWDGWDGNPLPNQGAFHAPPRLFFRLLLLGGVLAAILVAGVVWLVYPRLAGVWRPLPQVMLTGAGVLFLLYALWIGALAVCVRSHRNWLPPALAERGPIPRLMPLVERLGVFMGVSRDRVGNAALRVYNGLAAARGRPGVRPDDLLVLLPRCLGKDAMQGALELSGRYGVPVFVAARGAYARAMISRRRPKRVVAVACERDLVSGVHDVAARLPVLGTTLTLPDGPCKNTQVNLADLEQNIRTFLGISPATWRA
ncbi:MAG: DUF116 domain-containing protein [Longimicrobiaceae bacterium]